MASGEAFATYDLTGKLAVVTGAASGIGRATAQLFVEAGAHVVLADRNANELAKVAAELGNAATPVVTDVTDKAQVEHLGDVARAIGPIDAWVNAAGVMSIRTPMVEIDEATLDRVIAINLKGVYFCSAAAARRMTPEGKGSIVNVSSAGGDSGPAGLSVYGLTKAAVNAFSRSLANEVGPAGVRVNLVAPGFIDTPMVNYHYTKEDGSTVEAAKQEIFATRAAPAALKRIGQPVEMARVILFLASDSASFITGETLRANGGTDMR